MTYNAGTMIDLTETCDKILEYFYFRKSTETSLDNAQIELPFAYERFALGIKKLETNGQLKITKTEIDSFGKITSQGELFYRTNSYKRIESTKKNEEDSKRRLQKFTLFKQIFEIILGLITIALTIWTFTLDKKIDKLEKDIDNFQNKFDSLKVETLKKQQIDLNKNLKDTSKK